ncbi:hypothetical protein PMIN06_007531 [Paraphaeosphaeria minitans]
MFWKMFLTETDVAISEDWFVENTAHGMPMEFSSTRIATKRDDERLASFKSAAYIDAFYPLSTPFPAETEFPPCRILLKQSPKPGRFFITELLQRLYDHPQLEFAFEETWPEGGVARDLNLLFADKDRALRWKSALHSTVRKIVYSEAHSEATLRDGRLEEPYRIYRIKTDLHIFVETYGMRPAHLIEPSRSSVPIPLHKYLAELGLVRQKQGPISLSSASRSCFSRDGLLRRELGFGLKESA